MVSLAGFEPTPPDPKSGTLPDYAIERKLGGDRGYRTPLDILLARQNRSPLLPPYTGTQCWLRSNYSRLIKTVPHHSVYWAINTIMKTYKNFNSSALLETTKRPIIILSTPRSGSSVLGSYIQSVIGREVPFYPEPNNTGKETMDEFRKTFNQSKDFILKSHYIDLHRYGPEISSHILDEAYKVRIRRKDFFKQVASVYISVCRNRWHYHGNIDSLAFEDALPIDIERFQRNIEHIKMCNNVLQNAPIKYDQDLYYEDLPMMTGCGYQITPEPSNYDEILNTVKTLVHDRFRDGNWW